MLPDQRRDCVPQVVLYQPDIPGNTGTILRFCACLGLPVHIVEPAGFRLDDRSLKRAGMDYLELAALRRHNDWTAFEAWRFDEGHRLVLLTTKAEQVYTDFKFQPNDCLLFGRESAGVPDRVAAVADERQKVPMVGEARSLNVAMSVAMVAGEAVRQLGVASE